MSGFKPKLFLLLFFFIYKMCLKKSINIYNVRLNID